MIYLVCTIIFSIIIIFQIVKNRDFIWLCMFIPMLIDLLIGKIHFLNFITNGYRTVIFLILFIGIYFTMFLYDIDKINPKEQPDN
ncbi:hypothetical protein CN265_05275 [Priestia megaterium]|nr:hypothetical protein CN265_05275 [Priestia megaterium]PFK02186.1 hypothetical protein COI96_07280 [Priestia megaterium]PMD07947.1 hypothetical protein CJ194_18250 [Priestia megaterium]